jgi:hypothetical protein
LVWEAIAAINLKYHWYCFDLSFDRGLLFRIPVKLLIRPLLYLSANAVGFRSQQPPVQSVAIQKHQVLVKEGSTKKAQIKPRSSQARILPGFSSP